MTSAERLDDQQVGDALAALTGWERDGEAISRTFRAEGGFRDAIAFVVRLSYAAEAANHHPELSNTYDSVTVRLTTHDADGLTQRDVDLAHEVDAAATGLAS